MKLFLILVLVICLSSCSSKPYISEQTILSFNESKQVFIVNHGWHTGFVIPADDIQSILPELESRFNDNLYLEVGWGDKGFYQANEITSGLTIQAIFWPTESVVHVVGINELPDIYFSHSETIGLCMTETQYALLIDFIVNSFEKTLDGKIKQLRNGIYGNSQFYQGAGNYYLFNTCNKWTAKGLKSAGISIDPIFMFTASSVTESLSPKYISEVKESCNQIQEHDLNN